MSAAQACVVALFTAPASGAPMEARSHAQAVPGRGLEGDRYFHGNGEFSGGGIPGREVTEVTLIEGEVIDQLRDDHGIDVEPADGRRNIVTRGVRLNDLLGFEFRVGEVRLRGAGLCEPCVSLVKTGDRRLLRGLVHRGGLRASILSEGTIAVGDAVFGASPTAPGRSRQGGMTRD